MRVSRASAAPAVIFAVGAALRVRQFAAARSLYSDEAYVALNIATRSFRELLLPLTWDQTAPLLFLWAQRLAIALLGVNEYALRLLPLLAGLALLALIWQLARRLLGDQPALLAMAIAALSPLFIYYSNEAKPYGIDALVTVVLVYLTVRVIEAPPPDSPRAWATLAIAGAVGILLSTPAIFVMTGSSSALLLAPGVRRAPEGVKRMLGLALVWGLVFVAVYVAFLRTTAGSDLLARIFADWFLTPHPATLRHRLGESLWDVLVPLFFGHQDLLPPRAVTLLVVLAFLGLVALFRKRGAWAAALLLAPVAAAAAAAALGRWPLIMRTMFFAAPLFLLLVVSGIAWAASLLPRRMSQPALWAAGALFAFPSLADSARDFIDPPVAPQHPRPVIAEFERRNTGSEPVYVSHWGRATWAFYTTDWSAPDTARISWLERAHSPRSPADSARSLVVTGRESGDSFSRTYQGRTEIVQRLPPGVLMVYGRRETPLGVDAAAWADQEATRIRARARPYAWLFLSGGLPRIIGDVLAATERAGGHIVYEIHRPGADMYRLRFD